MDSWGFIGISKGTSGAFLVFKRISGDFCEFLEIFLELSSGVWGLLGILWQLERGPLGISGDFKGIFGDLGQFLEISINYL